MIPTEESIYHDKRYDDRQHHTAAGEFHHSPRAGQPVSAHLQRGGQHHRGQVRRRRRPGRCRHLQPADDAGHPLHQRHVPGGRHPRQHRVRCRRQQARGAPGLHHRHRGHRVLSGLLAGLHPAGESPAAAAPGPGRDPPHRGELSAHRLCRPHLHLLLQLPRRHHAGFGRQQKRPLLSDGQFGTEHRGRPVLC